MVRLNFKDGAVWLLSAGIMLATMASGAWAATGDEKLMIPVGHAQVVIADEAVKTVAIAEPKIADAAVGSERTVIVNGKTVGSTSLVVYGDGGRFRIYEIEVYSPTENQQVALHVSIAEVNEQAAMDLGFDLYGTGITKSGVGMQGAALTSKNPGVHSNGSGVIDGLAVGPQADGFFSFRNKLGDLEMAATWRALQEKGDLRILANPTLVAKSGAKASFLAGGEFPVPIASNSGAGLLSLTIEWKQFGVKLEFTPTVERDGGITLEVAPEVSQLDFSNTITLNGFVVPTVNTRKTKTTVHLNAGEHLVIGGLKQTDRTKIVHKVPLLGDLPIVGLFFSHTETSSVDRNLLVVVSPEMIVANSSMPKLPTDGLLTPKK